MSEKKKNRDEILDEIKNLAKKAENETEFSLDVDVSEFATPELDTSFLNDTQDPKKSHRLYYSIQSLIIANLPKGAEYKKLREFVNEEKLIFLNRGAKKDARGIRGSDSRQAYTTILEIALNTVIDWIKSGANAFELFVKFRDLNISYGYHDEAEKENISDFDEKNS